MSIPTIQRYRASILLATLLVDLFAFWLTKNRSGLKILTPATEPCSRVNKSVSICCTSHRNTKRSRKSFWLWLFYYVTWSFRQWIMSLSLAVPYSNQVAPPSLHSSSRSSHWQQEASSTGSPSSPFMAYDIVPYGQKGSSGRGMLTAQEAVQFFARNNKLQWSNTRRH